MSSLGLSLKIFKLYPLAFLPCLNFKICCCCRPHPPPKMVEGSNNSFYAPRPMVSNHLTGMQSRWSTGGPLHSTTRRPTTTGAVHKSLTFRCVFMLVQLNKCVVTLCKEGIVVMGVCLSCVSVTINYKFIQLYFL